MWQLPCLRERDLSHDLLAKEDHPSHPEEEDVMASLQERVGVKPLEVLRLGGGGGRCTHGEGEGEGKKEGQRHNGHLTYQLPHLASQIWRKGEVLTRTRYRVHLHLQDICTPGTTYMDIYMCLPAQAGGGTLLQDNLVFGDVELFSSFFKCHFL